MQFYTYVNMKRLWYYKTKNWRKQFDLPIVHRNKHNR